MLEILGFILFAPFLFLAAIVAFPFIMAGVLLGGFVLIPVIWLLGGAVIGLLAVALVIGSFLEALTRPVRYAWGARWPRKGNA